MLVWLDAASNRRGHPNENLARETMELFTLGIGNYTEDDVREAARASPAGRFSADRFEFNEKEHDGDEKVVLGQRAADRRRLSANRLGAFRHPRRLAWRLCQTYFGEGVVDDVALAELADGLRAHQLDIGWAVETILRSKLFFAPANLRLRVAGPVELVVGTLRALELTDPPASTLLLAEWVARMGQDLFYPPNVGGWSEGRSWLSSRSIVARANFADALVTGQLWSPSSLPPLEELAGRHVKGANFDESIAWLASLLWGESPAAAVAEVVAAAKNGSPPRPISRGCPAFDPARISIVLIFSPKEDRMFTRRRFLQTSSLLSLSPILPTLLANTARAATAGADERVLVVVQLGGGNDGLNTVVPYGDDLYAKARNQLRLKTDELHKLDDHVALHPRMKAAKQLFDDGRLTVVQNVGYPNPDRSHFRSMAIWQTATLDDARHNEYGWLGRASTPGRRKPPGLTRSLSVPTKPPWPSGGAARRPPRWPRSTT